MSEYPTTLSTNPSSSPAEHQERSVERQERPMARTNVGDAERWLSVIGGGALLVHGLRRSFGSLLLAVGGGMLIYRGVTGHCAAYQSFGLNTAQHEGEGVVVEADVTVNKPVAEVYRFYRNLENHPRFVTHLQSVQTIDGKRSHWVAKGPLQKSVEWDAEITEERENDVLSWRSLPGADVNNAGTVRFRELPGERGTAVYVSLEYHPPGGMVGSALGKLFNTITTQRLKDDLRHFKQLLEASERPTQNGQPAGRHA
jgi:uncharacterized membrane protein